MDKEMQEAFAMIREQFAKVNEKLDNTIEETRQTRVLVEAQDHKLELLMEAQSETKSKFSKLDRMEQTLNDVKSEVEVIRDVVRWHSGDIQKLKEA